MGLLFEPAGLGDGGEEVAAEGTDGAIDGSLRVVGVFDTRLVGSLVGRERRLRLAGDLALDVALLPVGGGDDAAALLERLRVRDGPVRRAG